MIKEIDEIIKRLGGLNLLSNEDELKPESPEKFIQKHSLTLFGDFLFFIEKYGASYFENWIEFIPKEKIPIAKKGNTCSIGRIHGWNKSNDSISKIYARYSNQINKKYLPFADGSTGDYICIKVKGENIGSIWYWHHESPEDEDLFLIENNFMAFLKSLKIRDEEKFNTNGIIESEVWEDDDFWKQFD